MKKYLSVLVIGLGCYCVSCNSNHAGGLSATAQKNLAANDSILQAFETKDVSKLGDYIATDAVDHAGDNGDVKGLDSIKASIARDAAAMTNEKSETIKALADDDYVMSWEHVTGAYAQDGQGHKAGDKFDMNLIDVSKYQDGKATEHWGFMQPADVMKMMSSMQQPMPADSTKKK